MQPHSPSTQQPYDFIFNEGNKPTKKIMPSFSGPVLILLVAVAATVLLIIVSALFLGKSKTSTTDLIDVLGRAQEISRVNTLEQSQISDPAALDLLATTQTALSSEQTDINSYAKAHKIKLNPKKLAAYQNNQTDSTLKTSTQNNNLNSAYISYLNQALQDYSNSLGKAYQDTKMVELKNILAAAYTSTQTLLGNPPKS